MIVIDDPTLPPHYVVENFRRAYAVVNGRDPCVRYMGNHWYHVNGETVHRSIVMEEIARLRTIKQRETIAKAEPGLIQRLIARLRAM
jgi:hypothetical protein